MGIVETRAGEGTFVRRFDFSEYIREVSDFVMSPDMLEGVMEFRKCIEIECVGLAIQRSDEADIELLEEAYRLYEDTAGDRVEPYERHIDDIVEADLNFHYQICKMSKNALFTLAFEAAREPMRQFIKSVLINRYAKYKTSNKSETFRNAAHDHRLILDAIKKREYEACRKVYIDMIDYHI
jgi:GntR family transcriptional repressor for pyruvate dehydrogenase complex